MGTSLSWGTFRGARTSTPCRFASFDWTTGKAIYTSPEPPTGGLGVLALSGDGKRAAASAAAQRIVVWDVKTGQVLASFRHGHGRVCYHSVVFSPDGKS